MKRTWILMLCILLLSGCGKKTEEPAQSPAAETPPVEVVSGSYTLTTQKEEYGPQTEELYFYLENNGGSEIMTGVDHGLQALSGESWLDVPFRENYGWTAEGLIIPPGERIALTCSLRMFDYDFSGGGTFRIVKAVGETVCTAEFRITAEPAMDPMIPLEELPADYGAANAEETAVVFTGDGVTNGEAVAAFLEDCALRVPGRLRTVQDYGEGAVMAIDVIYENDHILWRMWDGGEVTETRYSYVVTDGTDVYLSNGADWENTQKYDSKKALLVPLSDPALVEQVEQLTADRRQGNVTTYKLWRDGEVCAALTDLGAEEFSVSGITGGRTYYMEELGLTGAAVTDLAWQDDGCLLLTCKPEDNLTEFLTFDPKKAAIC